VASEPIQKWDESNPAGYVCPAVKVCNNRQLLVLDLKSTSTQHTPDGGVYEIDVLVDFEARVPHVHNARIRGSSGNIHEYLAHCPAKFEGCGDSKICVLGIVLATVVCC
jgi:hypothetical protein